MVELTNTMCVATKDALGQTSSWRSMPLITATMRLSSRISQWQPSALLPLGQRSGPQLLRYGAARRPKMLAHLKVVELLLLRRYNPTMRTRTRSVMPHLLPRHPQHQTLLLLRHNIPNTCHTPSHRHLVPHSTILTQASLNLCHKPLLHHHLKLNTPGPIPRVR